MKYSVRSGLGLGGVAMAMALLCVHCGDDDDSSGPPTGTGGDAAAGAGDAGTPGTGETTPGGAGGQSSGGSATVAGGAGGADSGAIGGATGGPAAEGGAGGEGGEPIVISGDHHGFVLDSITLPATSQASLAVAFDIDGDGDVDNQYGKIMTTLAAQGIDPNTGTTDAVQRGQVIMLADVQASSLANAQGAGFSTFYGTDPVPAACAAVNDCGKHLQGTGAFTVDPKFIGSPSAGSITATTFAGKGGTLPFKLILAGAAADLTLEHAHVEAQNLVATGFGPARIGGAIPGAQVDSKLLPALQSGFSALVTRDCTGNGANCGCTLNSAGANALTILDANKDCSITLPEVKANAAVKSVFVLDLDLDGDKKGDAMSIAFSATAKRATFDLP